MWKLLTFLQFLLVLGGVPPVPLVVGLPQGVKSTSPQVSPAVPGITASPTPQIKSGDIQPPGPTSSQITVGKTKGFEIKHGYSFNLASSPDGTPFSSGWAYLGGRAGSGPSYYVDNTGFLPTEVWSGRALDIASSSMYVAAAGLALGSLYYTFSPLWGAPTTIPRSTTSSSSNSNSSKKSAEKNPVSSEGEGSERAKTTETQNADGTKSEKVGRSRQRRDATASAVRRQFGVVEKKRDDGVDGMVDGELSRLASIVLNAIASGECLQKSICQLGTEVGGSTKGRLAFSLLSTLLPESLHNNPYFLTMKKSLNSEIHCDTFNCNFGGYKD